MTSPALPPSTLTIQPAPKGSVLRVSGLSERALLTAVDLAGGGGVDLGRSLDQLDRGDGFADFDGIAFIDEDLNEDDIGELGLGIIGQSHLASGGVEPFVGLGVFQIGGCVHLFVS